LSGANGAIVQENGELAAVVNSPIIERNRAVAVGMAEAQTRDCQSWTGLSASPALHARVLAVRAQRGRPEATNTLVYGLS
jgi:predicted RNA polymerase sigma factor